MWHLYLDCLIYILKFKKPKTSLLNLIFSYPSPSLPPSSISPHIHWSEQNLMSFFFPSLLLLNSIVQSIMRSYWLCLSKVHLYQYPCWCFPTPLISCLDYWNCSLTHSSQVILLNENQIPPYSCVKSLSGCPQYLEQNKNLLYLKIHHAFPALSTLFQPWLLFCSAVLTSSFHPLEPLR